jgi:hypothetical protein
MNVLIRQQIAQLVLKEGISLDHYAFQVVQLVIILFHLPIITMEHASLAILAVHLAVGQAKWNV